MTNPMTNIAQIKEAVRVLNYPYEYRDESYVMGRRHVVFHARIGLIMIVRHNKFFIYGTMAINPLLKTLGLPVRYEGLCWYTPWGVKMMMRNMDLWTPLQELLMP